MGEKKLKRPRPAKCRILPPDAPSLVQMVTGLTRKICRKADHMKQEPHDGRARRAYQMLFDQRAAAFARLGEMKGECAQTLADELGLNTEVSQ